MPAGPTGTRRAATARTSPLTGVRPLREIQRSHSSFPHELMEPRRTLGRGSLPVELTQFIGREHELAALRQIVGATRLLTLTGAGGSGKSRLALELAPHLAAVAPDGVAWVELAPLSDGALVGAEVLRALGAPSEGSAAATVDSISTVLRERELVVVLDNCEHLVEACATLADALLRACPGLRIVATSREALGVAGERAWLVPPLAVPDASASVAALEHADAVRLFVDRARDVVPDFRVTAVNATTVASICARLDGIPLAIELAAARVRHMTPDQILARLSDAFALLTTGARTALPRHRTLRATLDWSHDLLSPQARMVLRRLAVFRGGFALDGAETVAAGADIAAREVLDLLATLVDRSLVVVREQHGAARYQLLETVRQYAQQQLQAADELELARARLTQHIAQLVASIEPAFITTRRRAAFNTLEAELDNIREVLGWTHEHDGVAHVRLVGMLWWFWFSTRHWVEAHRWITGALEIAAAQAPTRERAALRFAQGALASLRGHVAEAQPALEEAASIAERLGDARLEAYALNYLGMVYAQQGNPEAREYSGRAEKWFRAHGDLYGLRLALLLVGMAEKAAGNSDTAMRMTREAVDIARSFGQDRELAVALQNLVLLMLDDSDLDAARPLLLESLHALRRDPSFLFIYRGSDYLAFTLADSDPALAARLLGASEAVRLHIGANRFRLDQERSERLVAMLQQSLGATYEHELAIGKVVPATEVLDYVLDSVSAVLRGDAAAAAAAPQGAEPAPTPAAEVMDAETAGGEEADLVVRALGPFEVVVRGRAIGAWPYTKPKELLAYLLYHPQGRTRVEIGRAIWPGAAPAQVRNSFHVTLHHLRKTLGESQWIVIENERYRIAADVSVAFDVTAFEQDVREGVATGAVDVLRRAMQRYRDHFLAGEPAAAWRDDVQDRLRRLYCDAGVRLGELLTASGEAETAASAFEAVVAREPLHEEAHRGLLLAWAHAGRRVHAMRHYERLATLLRHELDMEPEPETIELFDRIRSATAVNTSSQGATESPEAARS
jgi:predicted ATPase/DNA-binding SARP family transcriptional activator